MRSGKSTLKHFISEPITVDFSSPPIHLKSPPCPDRFTWREEIFVVDACLAEWKDFSRRGRMAQNMQPQHAQAAEKRGSWGVGRFYFDVDTKRGQRFRIYYDRAPKDAVERMGEWILLAELTEAED